MGQRSIRPRGLYGHNIWKAICKDYDAFFNEFIAFKANNGLSNKFWMNTWCGSSSLAIELPNMFALATCKDGSIRDHVDDLLSPNSWNLKLRRNLFDWEIQEAGALLCRLSLAVKGSPNAADKKIWIANNKGAFSVSSFVKALEEDGTQFGVWKFFWKSPLPSKSCFFLWLAYWGKVLTVDNIIARGMIIPNRCSMSMQDEESVNHLLVQCPMASSL